MRIGTLIAGDVRLTLRDRSSWFWIFVAPVLWVWMFGSVARMQSPSDAKVGLLVIDRDGSSLSGRLIEHLRSESFELTVVGPAETPPSAKEAPTRSVTIPAGFEERFGRREKQVLALVEKEGANPEGSFAAQVALHKATIRMLAAEALGGLDPADDKVRVRSEVAGGRRPPSGLYQSIPGNLVMFVLIATLTYGSALVVQERKNGLLRRLLSSPLSRGEIIAGKLYGRAAVASVQVGIFLLLGLTLFRISWGGSPLGLVLLLGSLVACAAALSLLAGTVFPSEDAASGAGVVLSLLMSGLGGCWWPSEVMPPWIQKAAHVFPTAWAMDGLHELLSWGGGLHEVLLPSAVLLGYAIVAGTIAARRLRAMG